MIAGAARALVELESQGSEVGRAQSPTGWQRGSSNSLPESRLEIRAPQRQSRGTLRRPSKLGGPLGRLPGTLSLPVKL